MGTHPIFESDFDCLTEGYTKYVQKECEILSNMLVPVLSWAFIWHQISNNFDQIMETIGIKHTPRKIQAEDDDSLKRWKFSNTRTSLVHSIVSGVWSVIILIRNPELFEHLENFDSRVKTMACCCFGYFIYDSLEIIKYLGFKKAWDILAHHAIVFGNLYYLCHQRALVGGICVGLANELANITLNIRMIMKMSGRNPGNSRYLI